MASVVVSMEYGGHLRKDLALPLHIPIRALSGAIAKALHQPENTYTLLHKLDGTIHRLPPNASLGDSSIFSGAILILQEEKGNVNMEEGGGAYLRSDTGDVFSIKDTTTLIGRPDQKNGIFVDVDLVPFDTKKIISRRHATISGQGNNIYLQDEGSVNGTYLNGQRLQPRQKVLLRDGDLIEFGQVSRGGVQMTFKNRQ